MGISEKRNIRGKIPMTESEMNSVKTDIALIKKDINQIEKVFKKVDDAIGQMSEILKAIAVQEAFLKSNEKRLTIVEKQILTHIENESKARKELEEDVMSIKEDAREDREKRHKELISCLNDMNKSLNEKLDNQDKRIRALENWRWYILGGTAVIMLLLIKFPWALFFG
jgi:chromosome segregation ATPase